MAKKAESRFDRQAEVHGKHDYHEPWTAARTTAIPRNQFPDGKPDHMPQDAYDWIMQGHEKLVANADWLLWGSRMHACATAKGLGSAQDESFSDQGILALFPPRIAPGASQSHSALCQRAAACVNACAGMADPVDLLNKVRNFLANSTDPEAVALLSRMLPPEKPFR